MSSHEFSAPKPHGPLRSYGRIKGRALSPLQEELLENLLPKIAIPAEPKCALDPLSFWPDAKSVVFEIGFGGGEHLIGQAKANPDTLYLGAEPFLEGVAKALTAINSGGLTGL
jgi:tRNA (guanine-N7-)-methyltransferase